MQVVLDPIPADCSRFQGSVGSTTHVFIHAFVVLGMLAYSWEHSSGVKGFDNISEIQDIFWSVHPNEG